MSEIPAHLLSDVQSFSQLLERLHEQRATGAVVIHFAQGQPRSVEVPCTPTTIRLDSSKKRAQG